MSWCKFYVQEFTNMRYSKPDDGKTFIKFGITHHMDTQKRFDPSVDDGYKKEYDDWNIRTLFSRKYDTRSEAEHFEQGMLHTAYPADTHKVWVESYLHNCDNRKYDNSGITEIRLLNRRERKGMLQFLYNDLSAVERAYKKDARAKLLTL